MTKPYFYAFAYFVEAIILGQYAANLFTARHTAKTRFAVLCFLYFILFAVSLFEIPYLNACFYFVINFIFLCTQYNLKWYSAFFHSAIVEAVMGMCELAVYSLTEYFAPHFLEKTSEPLPLFIFGVFNKLLFFTIMYMIIYFAQKHGKTSRQYDRSVSLLIFVPVTSIFVMLTLVYISDRYTLSLSANWFITLSAVFLLAANLLMFGINQSIQKKNSEYTQMQLLIQKEADSIRYYEMLRQQNENQRILIHDIKGHLQSIDTLNEQGEQEKIRAYIRQLVNSSDLRESARLCDNELLNSILCRYVRQCADRQIDFHADIRSQVTDFIEDNDLTALFCNLLDNAVEAAAGIPEAFIEIHAHQKEHTPFAVITMINSCRRNPFSSQGGSLTTSKPDKRLHGFGLKSIRRTIQKYDGDMKMYYSDDTLTFHTIVTLKHR